MTITRPTDPIEASGDLDGIVTRSVHNGFRCENFRHNIYTFEMHKPNPRPFSLLKGKTHTHYFESEQDSMSSHFYAKGPVFGSFEKMQAANQRRQANFPGTEWPFPVYRWVWFGSTDDSGVMHFGISNGDLLRWRMRPPIGGYEGGAWPKWSRESFRTSCAGPLDVLLDGEITVEDRDAFVAAPYDWNLDGQPVGSKDIDDFLAAWEAWENGEPPPPISEIPGESKGILGAIPKNRRVPNMAEMVVSLPGAGYDG